MKRMMLGCTFFGLTTLLALAVPGDADKEQKAKKEALQELNEFIGGWKGSSTSEKDKTAIWKENSNWSWRFKNKDVWLNIDFKDSKFFKSGEVRYLTDKGRYQMTLVDKADKKLVFEGELKKNKLTLQRTDPDKQDVHQVVLNTASEGLRFIWNLNVKPANRTAFTKEYQIAMTKEGTSFSSSKKQPECVVTGGLGTSTVTYKGVTYYVCCSGCRDAFNDNPEKIIKEYLDSKKKK